MSNTHIETETNFLFKSLYDEDLSSEEEGAVYERAQALISKYGWDNVFGGVE